MSNQNNCATCDHKRSPQGGWCYMFRDEPSDFCMKHTSRTDSYVDCGECPRINTGCQIGKCLRAGLSGVDLHALARVLDVAQRIAAAEERERWRGKVRELIMRESGVGFADAATAQEVLHELVKFGA